MNVISYSIYGTNNFYWQYLPCLIRAHHVIFNNWNIKFYHDSNIENMYYGNVLLELEKKGIVELSGSIKKEDKHCKAMLRRMMPLWEDKYEYVFCRDVDSLPTGRERWAMEKFMSTDAVVHAINDHKEHNIPMLGGMIGFNVKKFNNIMNINNFDDFFALDKDNYDSWDHKGKDQDFLNSNVWGKFRNVACVHRIEWEDQEDKNNVPYIYRTIDKICIDKNLDDIIENSNKYANFIGTDGYEKVKALKFFHRYGKQDIENIILKAESDLKVNAFLTF